jgi:predicted DNA-binding transcriptional regulator AlpA
MSEPIQICHLRPSQDFVASQDIVSRLIKPASSSAIASLQGGSLISVPLLAVAPTDESAIFQLPFAWCCRDWIFLMDSARGSIGQRLVSRDQAASYCGLSVSTFSNWVRIGRLPSAISGTSRWDLKAIDLALDSLSGLLSTQTSDVATSALDEWRAKRARQSQRDS